MRQSLLEAVAQTIDKHCYWARVRSLHQHQRYYTREDGQARETTCRCMTLEVVRPRRHYCVGRRWQIPEPDLDRAYSALRAKDDGFRRRCLLTKPSQGDVNALVLEATHGVIDLGIADDGDDFVPQLYKDFIKA